MTNKAVSKYHVRQWDQKTALYTPIKKHESTWIDMMYDVFGGLVLIVALILAVLPAFLV